MKIKSALGIMLGLAMAEASGCLKFGKRDHNRPSYKIHKSKATVRRRRANKITREIKQRIRRQAK